MYLRNRTRGIVPNGGGFAQRVNSEVFCVYQEFTVLFRVDYTSVLEVYRQFPQQEHLHCTPLYIDTKLDLLEVSQCMDLFL